MSIFVLNMQCWLQFPLKENKQTSGTFVSQKPSTNVSGPFRQQRDPRAPLCDLASPCHPKVPLRHFLQEAQAGANEVSESKVGSCVSRLGSGTPSHFIRHLKRRMCIAAGCDLPISWAFPTVSGLAGTRWFTLPRCCLPRTHGQLPASCLPLCVLALPSRELPRHDCQKPSFGKVKQPQVTYANICVFFFILLCSTWRKVCKRTGSKWDLGSLWIPWIKQQNPKNPLAAGGWWF